MHGSYLYIIQVSSVINVKSEGKAKDLKAFLFGDYFMSSKMVKNNEIDSSVPVRRMDKNTVRFTIQTDAKSIHYRLWHVYGLLF